MVLAPFSAAEPIPRDTRYYGATARTVFLSSRNRKLPLSRGKGRGVACYTVAAFPPSAGEEFPARQRAMKESECPPVLSTTIPPSPAHCPITTLPSRPTTSAFRTP